MLCYGGSKVSSPLISDYLSDRKGVMSTLYSSRTIHRQLNIIKVTVSIVLLLRAGLTLNSDMQDPSHTETSRDTKWLPYLINT